MQINDPAVVAEVTALHERYEKALVTNDIVALTAFFWDSEQALRFGIGESLYGAAEIEAFRKARPVNNLDREVFNLRIVTFGDAHAAVTLEFRRKISGIERHGRQSQIWVKFPEGWKIASAHVSFTPQAYVDTASALIGLPIPAEWRDGVRQNIERAAQIAASVLSYPIPEGIESAQVFEP